MVKPIKKLKGVVYVYKFSKFIYQTSLFEDERVTQGRTFEIVLITFVYEGAYYTQPMSNPL